MDLLNAILALLSPFLGGPQRQTPDLNQGGPGPNSPLFAHLDTSDQEEHAQEGAAAHDERDAGVQQKEHEGKAATSDRKPTRSRGGHFTLGAEQVFNRLESKASTPVVASSTFKDWLATKHPQSPAAPGAEPTTLPHHRPGHNL